MNGSQENEPTKWKINLFTHYNQNTNTYLRCGNVIWLHHSEANASLGALRINNYNRQTDWSDLDFKDNLEVSTIGSGVSNTF